MPALYCGTSIAICALEKFVHVGASPIPPLVLVAVDIPDTSAVYTPTFDELPLDWDAMPISSAAQKFGGAWLTKGKQLAMSVPSAIVREERNMVINARHPDYRNVGLTVVRPFAFDDRMFK
jgi:RES domain-containing protein